MHMCQAGDRALQGLLAFPGAAVEVAADEAGTKSMDRAGNSAVAPGGCFDDGPALGSSGQARTAINP